MINNRQNGRRRGRGGNSGGGNNNQRSGNTGRPDSGNRIDNRARGNANQLYEKYKNLARDAQMSGDRVNTEYYLQFADHYFRVLNETRTRFEEQNPNAAPPRRIQPVDSFDDFDGDDDYGDEGEPIRAGEQELRGDARGQQGETRGQQERQPDRQPEQGQRPNHQRDGGQRDNRDNGRQGQPRYEGRRDEPRYDDNRDGNRGEARRNGYAADDGERPDNRQPDSRQPDNRQPEQDRSADRYAMTGSPIANDHGEDSPDGAELSPVEPRRRGRPRRVVAEAADEAPAALDADRLPPSLSIVSEKPEGDDGAPRPRRRRVRAGGEASTLG